MLVEKACIYIPREDWQEKIKKIERYGRVCYKSEDKLLDSGDVSNKFLEMLIAHNHESVLEHEKITMIFIIDRGISHELVRHRIASYSQESTRYCNYGKEKFGQEITFIDPKFFQEEKRLIWENAMKTAEQSYFELLESGATPGEARSVLPNSLKTEIVVTMNIRSLRNFLKQRCAPSAHFQIKEVAIPLLKYLQREANVLFKDLQYDRDFKEEYYGKIIETDSLFREEV